MTGLENLGFPGFFCCRDIPSFRDVKNTGCNFAARVSNLLTMIRKDGLTARCSEGA